MKVYAIRNRISGKWLKGTGWDRWSDEVARLFVGTGPARNCNLPLTTKKNCDIVEFTVGEEQITNVVSMIKENQNG